jgi:two-component system sensor histidine kinase HydH
MDIRTQSALLACIVSLALAVSVLLRAHRPRALTLFAVLCGALSAFYLGDFLHAITQSLIGLRVAIFTGGLVPTFALTFFMEFLGVSPRSARRGRWVAVLGAVMGLGVAASPLVTASWPRQLVTAWVFGALTVTFSLIVRRRRAATSRVERLRLLYLAAGAAASILFSATDLLYLYGIPFPSLGAIATTLYLFFLAQTLQRLRLLDLHELLGKVASLSVLALILAAIYGALVSWVGSRPGLFLFNTLIASFVILILFEPLRAKVEEWVVATLFTERFQMLRALTALKARVASIIEMDELARVVLETLHETRRVTHASIYLLADSTPGFNRLDYRGPDPVPFVDAAAARGLLAAASTGQKAVLKENVERRLAELRGEAENTRRTREELKRLNDILSAMGQMKAGITVPLVGGERIVGFLNLWDERVAEAYASDEIAMVLEIGERVSTVVENSKLFERMKERDRLAALGEMAAGLAHEIRNPLGAIKGAAQFLDPTQFKGEDGEFLGVIVEEVNRLNGVVTQFLDYSRPLKQNFGPTDLNDVLTRTARLLQPETDAAKVEVKLELDAELPKAFADAEQLKQVFINLAQNAIQAMPHGGTLTIKTARPDEGAWRLSGILRGSETAEVRFADTGKGIPEEQQTHIFVPFYTTKEKGTGLGLAISQRIVKSHGGTISVTSKRELGTEFVLRLPALPEPKALMEGTPSPEQSQVTTTGSLPVSALPAPARDKRTGRREKKRRGAGG